MKKITSAADELIGGYLVTVARKRKYKRYWGTETINGIEVFRPRRYIYPFSLVDDNLAKFLKLLKAYEDIKSADMKGVENAWFFLNYNKLSQTSQDYYTKEWIADMLENSMVYDTWYTFYLNFTTRRYGDGWTSSPTLIESRFKDLSNVAIYNDVITNYATIYDTHLMQGRSNELLNMEELSKFLLFNDQVSDFTIEPVRITKAPVLKTTTDNEVGTTYSYIENTISIEYRAKRVSQIDENTTLVNKIYTTALQKDINQIMAESQADNDGMYSPPPPPPPPGFEVMFYNGQLRVDYYDSLKSKDAAALLNTLLDTGIQKKKVKWYKKLLVLIIVFIVVWFLGPQIGYMLAAALAFTVCSIYAAKNGDYALAEWSGGMAQISFKIAAILSVYDIASKGFAAASSSYGEAAFDKAWEEGMKEYAKEEGKEYATKSVYSYMAENILSSAADIGYSGITKFIQYTAMAYDHIAKSKMKDIQTESADVAKKSEDLAQAQSIANLDEYLMTLTPFQIMDKKNKVLDSLDASYYNKYDGQYDGTKFIIMKLGPFAPVGVFNPSYAEQTSLAMRKRS